MSDFNQNGYSDAPAAGSQKKGLSVAALIFGLLSLFGLCCCGLGFFLAPIAIILGIAAVATKKAGKGLAITGIIMGLLSLVMVLVVFLAIRPILPYREDILKDYTALVENQDEVFAAYEQDGTIPDYLKKYEESPFKEFFEKYDLNIYKVMDAFLDSYKKGSFPKTTTTGTAGNTADALIVSDTGLIPVYSF